MAAIAFTLGSCSTPKHISYFQDAEPNKTVAITSPTEIKIQPKDKLTILVSSQDPRLSSLFNLPIVTQQVGMDSYASTTRGLSGYTVDSKGNIDFPVLGAIHIEGMTREQTAAYIKQELQSHDLLKEPVVTVEFQNLEVNILGEVSHPGSYSIDRDHLTLIDALSQAGDLTINGMRQNVKVLRTEEGQQHTYEVNLCSAKDTYSSPVYYLKQNDVIYVEPNGTKARQSTVNGNNIRSTSFWMSLTSLIITIVVLFK